MKDNTLLLLHSIDSPWGKYMKEKGYHVFQTLKNQNFWGRAIRRFVLNHGKQDISIRWLEDWCKEIDKYDKIIIFANPLYRKIIKWIQNNAKKARIIVWYMDPYSECPLVIDNLDNVEQWSFDEKDCQNRGFNFLNTFYCFSGDDSSLEEYMDVFFIGVDKGRYEYISKIRDQLIAKGIGCNFFFVKEKWIFLSLQEIYKRRNRKYSQYMPYDKLIQNVKQSRALLDINQKEQSGLSQRPLEALFYNKKLITNNDHIREMDFYDENNIYIIKNESLDGIEDFLLAPFHEIPVTIKEKYTFEKWISHF